MRTFNFFTKIFIIIIFIAVSSIYVGKNFGIAEAEKGEKDYTKSRGGKMDDIKSNYYGYCSPCHGDTGKGDGPLAETLEQGVEPRDHTSAEYFSQKTDKDIFEVIKFGGIKAGFSEAMPPFDGQLSDDEMRGLVKFIRVLCKCQYKK